LREQAVSKLEQEKLLSISSEAGISNEGVSREPRLALTARQFPS
jgi:hypothetical protein